MAKLHGIEGMSGERLKGELAQGGKFVIYLYAISILVMTFRRSSDIYYIGPGQSAVVKGLPYTLLSLFLGWWGFPWGLIYTPHTLYVNLRGGRDVTAEVTNALAAAPASASALDLPRNPW